VDLGHAAARPPVWFAQADAAMSCSALLPAGSGSVRPYSLSTRAFPPRAAVRPC